MELTDPEIAVLWHAYDSGPREPEVLAADAANDPPLPFRRGQLAAEACEQAILEAMARGLLHRWSGEALEAEYARWEAESLPRAFGVDFDLEPGWIDLTEAGWRWCLDRWGRDRRFALYNDETPGYLCVFGESPASCMTERDKLTYKVDHGQFYTYNLTPQPGPVLRVGEVERIRGWWYNRFHCIRPGYVSVIEYVPAAE